MRSRCCKVSRFPCRWRSKATMKVGDVAEQVFELEWFALPKTNKSVGFSVGALAVKELSVSP